jgi:hypothetical protein
MVISISGSSYGCSDGNDIGSPGLLEQFSSREARFAPIGRASSFWNIANGERFNGQVQLRPGASPLGSLAGAPCI